MASAAFHDFGRIYGVNNELERLKNTVESIRVVLLDAEEKQETQNHAARNWVRRLNDVLYPAFDLLDEFVIQDMKQKMDVAHKSKVSKVLRNLSPTQIMARKLKRSKRSSMMSGLNLNPNSVVVVQSNNIKRETDSYVSGSDIIGREDDKKKIISLLKQPFS